MEQVVMCSFCDILQWDTSSVFAWRQSHLPLEGKAYRGSL